MCVDEVSRAHSALTGMAIRLAECMGMHRDPSEYGFSPAECQVRRLIWYQICYLDLKTSEIQGPRPYIHHNGYTTQIPSLNTTSTWNDMMVSMIRFECQEMQRECLVMRSRVDQKKISLTKALSKIEAFRISMDTKYGPFIDSSSPNPMQKMARQVMKLFTSLLYLISLHRYMNSVTYRVPDRLRQIVLSKGTDALEAAVELESAEELKQWSWYSGAYHQYHTAFLLLVEVFTFPMRRQANRIWRCLDFIFAEALINMPSLETYTASPTLHDVIAHRDAKARCLLTLICQRMRVYRKSKGLKNPVHFKDSMIILTPQKDGDTSDPRMPLNYAHGEPVPEAIIHHRPRDFNNPISSSERDREMARIQTSSTRDVGAETAEFLQVLDNAAGSWASSCEDFSLVAHGESDLEAGSNTNSLLVHPRYNAHIPTPNESSTYSHQGDIQREMEGIDPQMLEIDWVRYISPSPQNS